MLINLLSDKPYEYFSKTKNLIIFEKKGKDERFSILEQPQKKMQKHAATLSKVSSTAIKELQKPELQLAYGRHARFNTLKNNLSQIDNAIGIHNKKLEEKTKKTLLYKIFKFLHLGKFFQVEKYQNIPMISNNLLQFQQPRNIDTEVRLDVPVDSRYPKLPRLRAKVEVEFTADSSRNNDNVRNEVEVLKHFMQDLGHVNNCAVYIGTDGTFSDHSDATVVEIFGPNTFSRYPDEADMPVKFSDIGDRKGAVEIVNTTEKSSCIIHRTDARITLTYFLAESPIQ